MDTVYSSKIDIWLAALLGVVAIGILALTFHMIKTRGPTLGLLVMLPALAGAVGLPAWLLASTHYTLTATELHIKSGPVALTVPLAQIASITPTSDARSSPALSLDRLRIDYGQGRSVMISPKDKERFLREIDARRNARQ